MNDEEMKSRFDKFESMISDIALKVSIGISDLEQGMGDRVRKVEDDVRRILDVDRRRGEELMSVVNGMQRLNERMNDIDRKSNGAADAAQKATSVAVEEIRGIGDGLKAHLSTSEAARAAGTKTHEDRFERIEKYILEDRDERREQMALSKARSQVHLEAEAAKAKALLEAEEERKKFRASVIFWAKAGATATPLLAMLGGAIVWLVSKFP